jgi:regulatory protein
MISAKDKALYYLSRFSRTEKQVKDYLRRKQYSPEEIASTIAFLKEKSFLNDSGYAEAFIQSRIQRLDGPFKIKQMLFQKGIDSSTADSLLNQHYPEELQLENAKAALQKRSGDRMKQMRFLASRGFPQYVILHATGKK